MASREPSPVPSSEGDTIDDSRLAPAEVDDAASPSDHPGRTDTPSSTKGTKRPRSTAKKPRPKKGATVWVNEGVEATEDESPPKKIKKSGSEEPDVKGTAVGTRRQANGTVGSVYSGSKIRHIKKQDGIPLWRKDIQYAFLNEVVHDETKCFTRYSDDTPNCTFADIYIDSMARSSKTSKILKDRLHVDKPAALNMAMICLLVNVGRMNTTLNFFPEMRAQLRTYHPIPSLQAYPTQKDYKSLQDAPRLKSILKGASEDEEQPRSLPQLRAQPIPRTNPVNLIFVLSQFANDISQLHFLDKIDFFDLAIRHTISSHTRAVAFLWLMWWYLESDFSKDAALNNPFGPGLYKESQDPDNPDHLPLLVPKLDPISDDEGDAENHDPEEEIEFGAKMTKERERFNAKNTAEEGFSTEPNGKEYEHKGIQKLKRTARDLGDDLDSSDVDSRASPSAKSPAPVDTPGHGLQADSLEDDWEPVDAHPGRGRWKRIKGKNTPSRSKPDGSMRATGRSRLGLNSDRGTPDTGRGTPQPPGLHHPILSQYSNSRSRADPGFDTSHMNSLGIPTSKSRARTGYQRELEQHRQKRIEWLVNKKRKTTLKEQRRRRANTEPSWLLREAYKIAQLDTTYDSEEDDTASAGLALLNFDIPPHRGTGFGGLLPTRNLKPPPSSKEKSGDTELKKEKDDNSLDEAIKGDDLSQLQDECGEEAEHWKRIFLRTQRRLVTWSGEKDVRAHYRSQQREERRQNMPLIPARSRVFGSIPPSSIANSTPRKPRHESRKSLEDEINEGLLAERSADEGDEDEDGDVTMTSPGRIAAD